MWFTLKQLFPGSTDFTEAIFKIPQISKHFSAMLPGPSNVSSKTAFLLITFRNRQRWEQRNSKCKCNIFWKKVELEEYSIYSVYSTLETGIAGRARKTGTVVIDQERMWTLNSPIEWFLFHQNWNSWSSECLFLLFLFLKSFKRNAVYNQHCNYEIINLCLN